MNDIQFKLVKRQGDFVCHHHDDTVEVCLVIDGQKEIEFRDGQVELKTGEMYAISKGKEHTPYTKEECHAR